MDLREQIRIAIGGALAAQEGSDGAADAVMEVLAKQKPLDAGSDVFRSAFEAALKAGNWPATRQGDGYRSPSTQIAWRIAFSTVNRLKLHLAPGAQPAPSVPEVTDAMIEAIESRAEQSYRRHHGGTRGQQIVPADALSWHIIHATRKVLSETPEAKP